MMDHVERLEKTVGLTPNFGFKMLKYLTSDVNHVAPLRSPDEVRKAFMYLLLPISFGRDYPDALLSKVAKHLKLFWSGPLDPANHTTAAERSVLLLALDALTILLGLNDLPMPILPGRVEEIRAVWKITDPLDFLNFGRMLRIGIGFEWIKGDEHLLLFIIALCITHDDRFRDHVFNEVTQCEGRRFDEEADRVFQEVLKTKDSEGLHEALRLIKKDIKLNPFSPELYGNLWSAYSCLGEHEYACWCASRQVWLDDNTGYLNWMNSAEAQGNRQVAMDVGEALLTFKNCQINSAKFDAFYQDVTQALSHNDGDGIISIHSLPALISNTPFRKFENIGQFVYCSPVTHLHSPTARNVVKTSTDPFLQLYTSDDPHYIAFRDNYGFIPFQWINQFSHDKIFAPEGMERAAFHGWFLLSIHPLAFGVNYPYSLVSIWVEAFHLFCKIPTRASEISTFEERENIKRIFQVFSFVIFDKERLLITLSEIARVFAMQNPRSAVEYGRRFLSKAFGSAVSCLDDDKQVCLFLVVLLVGVTDYLCQLALDASVGIEPTSEIVKLRNRAKGAMMREEYPEALKVYRKALSISPTDSIIFSNMAQVYIKIKSFELAKWFALRAIWLAPNQPKNHYRWCKATALSGDVEEALAIIDAILASLSKSDEVSADPLWSEIRSLRKQLLSTRMNNNNEKPRLAFPPRFAKIAFNRSSSKSRKTLEVIPPTPSSDRQVASENGTKMAANVCSTDAKKCEILSDSSRFYTFVQSGSQQFLDQLYKSASESYTAAIEILNRKGRMDLHLSEMDEVVLKYCFAMACIRRHTYQHIRKGIEVFEEILQEYSVPFPMAYYGKGCAYVLMNRFTDGIGPLQKALEIVEKTGVHLEAHAFPGLPDKVIDESRRDELREDVIALLDTCRCPPSSNATCHAHDANTISDSHHVSKIYCSDPEFHGYVRMTCRERCTIEFHPLCYKKFAEEMKIHGDKDVIGLRCMTPDCNAVFIRLQIFGSDGIVRKTLPEESESKVKTAKTQVKNKTQIRKEVTKKTFKKRFPTLSSNSADDGDQQTVCKESSNDLESKEEAAFRSRMDKRSAEVALRILKKKHDKVSSPVMQIPVPKKRSSSECVQTSTVNLTYADRHRIDRLDAQKIAVESNPGTFRRISVSTDPPVSNPVQPDNYLWDFEASRQQSVDDRVLMDSIEASSLLTQSTDQQGLLTIIDFVKQFVIANGPISLSSAQFLDFINCIPIELQDLISRHENGISGLLNFCPVLFIGDVVFTRENVLSALSSGSISSVASLDLAVRFRDNSTQTRSDLGGVRKFRSVPSLMHLGRHLDCADDLSGQNDDRESCDESSGEECGDEEEQTVLVKNEDQPIGIGNDVFTEELSNDLENLKKRNRLLTEQLQCHRDKLFVAQKETELAKKAKLQEVINGDVWKREQKDVKKNFDKITTELRLELKQLRTKYAAEVKKSRSAEDERRKGVILQEEVDDLRRNLVAMESNHSAVMTENRNLMGRLLVLENESEADKGVIKKMKIKMQEMASSVDKMASHGSSQFVMPNIPVLPKQLLLGGVKNLPVHGVQDTFSMPPANIPLTALTLEEHNFLHRFTNTLSQPHPLSQSPPSTVPTFKVPLLPSPKPNRSLVQPSSGSDKAFSLTASNDAFGKYVLPPVTPEPAIERRCSSSFEDSYSEGGRSYDSMAKELSLPYSMGTAAASFPCNDAVGSSKCQAEVIFNELRNNFQNLTKAQFVTYIQFVKSRASKGELNGLKLKDIVRRMQTVVQQYRRIQVKPKVAMSDPPIVGPSFWSEGPGAADGGSKSKKTDQKDTASEMEIVSDDVCAICLYQIKAVDAHFMQCPGRHCYHFKCIRQWYGCSQSSQSCPKCGLNVPLVEDFPKLGK